MVSKHVQPLTKLTANKLLNQLHDTRQKIHELYGLDVSINITIHNWNSTLHLANVVLQDMTGNHKKEWQYQYLEIPNALNKGILHCFEATGQESNKGICITIFKNTDQKKHRHTPTRTSTKRFGPAAMAINQIHTVLYDLYGVTARVKIEGNVSFITEGDKTDHLKITEKEVLEMLSSIRSGTKWNDKIEEVRFSTTHGKKYFKLLAPHMEFVISCKLGNQT